MILKDLITDVLDIADSSEIGKFISKKNPSIKSITRANKDLTMIFPVMASSTIEAASAQLVGRALERKFVTLTQMLLSAISITSSKDAIDHLKNVHSNLDLNNFFDVDDYIYASQESAVNHIFDTTEIKAVYEAYKQQRLTSKPINHLLETDYSDSLKQQLRAANIMNDKEEVDRFYRYRNSGTVNRLRSVERDLADSNTRNRELTANNTALQSRIDAMSKVKASLPNTRDADYKKANELQPSVLQIQFISTNDNNDPITVDAYIGVKTKLYAVDANDINNHIVSKRSYNFSLYNLIKATSGEIEFWRDFVFAIKKAKIDAVSNTNRGSSSKLWKVLERRAIASKLNRFMSARNDATAITTLMMSAYDVEMLRKMEDIDISDSRVARKLMDDYNLVGIVIVDDSTESAKFIFDTGDDEYETYTFRTLKRDDKMDYKQMIQLLAGGK